ncbi:MAG: hypothetical protein G01um101470_530, partial [Parcubacteria group bacterium Gr01-1014_70]
MLERIFGILWGRMIAFLCLLPLLVYGAIETLNLAVGPLTNALWEDLLGNSYVKTRNYTVPPPIPLVIDFERPLIPDDLKFLEEYSRYLKIILGKDWVVASMANYFRRVRRGPYESFEPYTNMEDESFSMDAWKTDVRANAAVYGSFIDTEFRYFVIHVGYPENLNELTAIRHFRRVVERRFPPEQKSWLNYAAYHIRDYLYHDFVPYKEPEWPKIYIGGWPVGKALIQWSLCVDVLVKSVVGFTLLLIPFLLLVFHKPHTALAIWTGTLCAFLATLAGMGPLTLVGIHFNAYSLPALIGGVLIMSTSFNTQIMEEIQRRDDVLTLQEWKQASATIGNAITYIFVCTLGCFVLFGFTFQALWRAVEMDAVLVLGSCLALVVQRWILPALYFFYKARRWQKPLFLQQLSIGFDRSVENSIQRWTGQYTKQSMVYALLAIPVIAALFLMRAGWIDTNSYPIEFLGHSNGRTMLEEMVRKGRNDVITIYIHGIGIPNAFRSEKFFQTEQQFEHDVENVSGIGNALSGYDQVAFEMTRLDGLAVPFHEAVEWTLEGAKNIHETFPDRIQWKNEAVLIYADHPIDNARGLNTSLEELQRLAETYEKKYPWLKIAVFGEILHFPPLAVIIAEQTPWLLLYSLAAVFFCFSYVVRRESPTIPCVRGGWILTQTFLFAGGMVGLCMGVFGIPLNMATAAIVPVVIGSASDFTMYPSMEFFALMRKGAYSTASEAAAEALRRRGKAVSVDCWGNMLVLCLLTIS